MTNRSKQPASLVATVALLLLAILPLMSINALGSLDLTVKDKFTGDDIAHVILFYPDGSETDLGYTPEGTTGSTWNLLSESQILTKGAGTYTLRIIHHADVDATCVPPPWPEECEVRGTYDISFSGGIVVATVDDSAAAAGGQPTTIDILANDLLVNATAFAFGEIPCPYATPLPTCECCKDGSTQCPSDLRLDVNYVQGLFYVTVGDGSLGISSVTNPPHGSAVIVGDQILYTPDPGYCGIDTFTYTAQRNGSSDTGTVTMNVSAAPPVPQDDLATVPEGVAIVIDVLSNDSAAGGGALTLHSVGSPSHGIATIVGDTIRYAPQARFEGNDRFPYAARNVCGVTATGWVEVSVLHTNHPPVANAGAFYRGFTGEPVELDASFSHDPDIEDTLQYRWDLDDDQRFDTDWSNDPVFSATYTSPYVGRIAVEVRDVYRGQPTGASNQATALARLELRPPELHGLLFVDLDSDGLLGENDSPLPKIRLELDGETFAVSGDDGVVRFANLDAGEHTLTIAPDGLALLQLQGFGIGLEKPSITLDVQAGPPMIARFPARSIVGSLSGVVYVDLDGSGEQEQGEPVVPGLAISLGKDLERTTDEEGRFLFMNVLAGEYNLAIESEQHRWEGAIRIDAGEKTEKIIIWPAADSGFLEIKVELNRQGVEEGD